MNTTRMQVVCWWGKNDTKKGEKYEKDDDKLDDADASLMKIGVYQVVHKFWRNIYIQSTPAPTAPSITEAEL